MSTRNIVIAVAVGLAFVAGGFFAGTLGSTDAATALDDGPTALLVADDETQAEDVGPGEGFRGHRHPGHHLGLGEVADELGLDLEAMREAIADGATVAEAAEAQGVATDDLVAALVAAGETAIDDAVENGRIDAERADELKDALTDRVTAFVESSPADRRFVRDHPVAAAGLRNAAEVIGIDASELADALRDGQSVAEVAEANGVSRDELVSGLLEIAEERIEEWIDRVPGG